MAKHSASSNIVPLILEWACEFREGELTVEDIQDRFATISTINNLPPALRKCITEAQQELDAIRYGMCENGQRAEITRIFCELEGLITKFSLGRDRELNRD